MVPVKKMKYQCETCKKVFDRVDRLEKHTSKCNGIKCPRCNLTFLDMRALQRHQQKAKTIICNHCPRTFCSIDGLEQHKRSIPQPLSHDPKYSLDTPICPKTGYEDCNDYKEELFKHRNVIRDHTYKRNRYTVINKETSPDFTYRDLRYLLGYITGKDACKVNLGFGFMLYNTIDDVYKYYYVSSNNLLFEKAFQISTNTDITKLFLHIVDLDLINNYYLKKPSSSWVLAGLPNIELRIYPLENVPIGAGITLPTYTKDARAIISLTHDENHGHQFTDNNCLALHQGARIHALEKKANALRTEYEGFTKTLFKDGVEVKHLPALEIYFQIAINVYELHEDRTAHALRLSKLDLPVMHLNLYKNNCSYIKDFKKYAKKYTCQVCGRIMKDSSNIKRHTKGCSIEVKEIYIGGKWKGKKNIFQLLDAEGLKVPE